jgi:hypothetical protein
MLQCFHPCHNFSNYLSLSPPSPSPRVQPEAHVAPVFVISHHFSIMCPSCFHHAFIISIISPSFCHDIIMSHIPIMFPQFFITSRQIQLSNSHYPYTGWLVHIPIIYSTPNKPAGINLCFLTNQQRYFPWLNSPSPKIVLSYILGLIWIDDFFK